VLRAEARLRPPGPGIHHAQRLAEQRGHGHGIPDDRAATGLLGAVDSQHKSSPLP